MKRGRGDTCKWRCRGSPRDNERHGLFILSSLATPPPLQICDYTHTHTLKKTHTLRYHDRLNLLTYIHKHTCFLLTSYVCSKLYVCVCVEMTSERETRVQPIMRCFLSGSGRVSTNHKVNIAGPVLPVHLLNSPIKAELAVCSQRSRIYLSCSNWLIVAVLG